MNKRPTWKQDTPAMQMVAIMQSIQGDISNLRDGTIKADDVDRVLTRVQFKLDELMELKVYLSRNWFTTDDAPVMREAKINNAI